MQKRVELSVILPCYNAEHYIENIVNSFTLQTFQNFELIVINDGGSKKQLDLIRKLASIHEEIVVLDQKNGGVYNARNNGLRIAKGDWISFVDADDDVSPSFLANLYSVVHNTMDVDLVTGGYTHIFPKNNKVLPSFLDVERGECYSKREVYELLDESNFNALWNKLYRKKVMEENRLIFNENLRIAGDAVFNYQFLLLSKKIALVPDSGYKYYMRDEDSITSSYNRTLKEARNNILRLKKKLLIEVGYSKDEIQDKMSFSIYRYGYFYALNLFKINCPLSFSEKKVEISNEILNNNEFMFAFKTYPDKKNVMLKIFDLCIKMRSAFFFVSVYNLLFFFKYNFRKLYYCLNQVLKKT